MLRRIAAVTALGGAGLALAAAHAPGAAPPELLGRVGPSDGEITMFSAAQPDAVRLAAGTYTLHVADETPRDNFHIFGPGVDEATGVGAVGDATWTLTLIDGIYTVRSDAHTWMRFIMPVGDGQPAETRSADPILPLVGRIGPGKAISLRRPRGALVRTLRHGDYRIRVHDRSSSENFHLLASAGLSLATGVRSVGDAEWVVRLVPGRFTYRSDAHPKTLARTVTVS